MHEQWRVCTIDTTKRPPLAEVRAWPSDGEGSRFVCEALVLDAERIVRDHDAAARLEIARREVERLRAYAMALRGDLVEVDSALAADDMDTIDRVIGRHMHGTLDQDVASLARPAPDDTTPGSGREDG